MKSIKEIGGASKCFKQYPLFLVKCKLVKHRGTPIVYNKILIKNNVKLRMQTHKMSLDEKIKNLNLDRKL
jgi:hypothetical protein